MKRSSLVVPLLFACALAVLPPPEVVAQDDAQHVLRLATLLPRGGRMQRGLTRWNNRLRELTDGRVSIRVYWGGSMGDERTMVRRMRIGQLDGASMTSGGLAQIYRPVLVMQAPGIFETYAQVDAVREQVGPEMARGMEAEGFTLLGWGDAGRVRLFSRGRPVRQPSDLRSMRPWVPREDVIFRRMLEVVGANGVPLGVGEVFGGLRTRMIDVVPGTAIAAAALQWFTSLEYVTEQSDGFLIGGMVIRRGFLQGMSEADRAALLTSATENHDEVIRASRRGDEQAYRALTRRGLTAVEVGTRTEWTRVARETREGLIGRVYPAALLRRVEGIATAAR